MALIANSSPYLQPLGYADLDASEQALVNALITAASELMDKFLGRTIEATTHTEIFDGDNQDSIFLSETPVNSVTSVSFINQNDGTTETIDDAEFQWNPKTGELYWKPWSTSTSQYNGSFPRAIRNISVIYNAGWAPGSIPAPLQKICADLVMLMYDPKLAGIVLEKEKLGEYFYQMNVKQLDNLLIQQSKMLSLYRKRVR